MLYISHYQNCINRSVEVRKKEIPVFIFIDKNVYAEYQTYRKNQERTEKGNEIDFAHVDSINVFKFINYIDVNKKKAIKTFDEIEEMENYLSEQIAGWLYLYLEQLQKKSERRKTIRYGFRIKGYFRTNGYNVECYWKKKVLKKIPIKILSLNNGKK